MTQRNGRAAKLALSWILLCRSIGIVHGIGSRGIEGNEGRRSELFEWRGFKGVRSPRGEDVTDEAMDSADAEEGMTDDEVEFYGLARRDGEAMAAAAGTDNEEENAEADEALAKTSQETFIRSHNEALREVATNTSRNLNEQLSTIAISTFLLELTIQREPFRRRNIRNRRLSDESVDDLLQTLAERHLSSVYSNAFDDVPDPSQVLLTVVTTTKDDNDDDDEKEDPSQQGGIYIRQSFIGGVVSFPTGSSDNSNNNNDPARIPTRAELEQVTFKAFAIPGLGEDFLKELLRENHPELKGLLLLGAKEVEASQNGVGGNVDNGSGSGSGGGNLLAPGSNSNIDNGNNNDPAVDAQTDSANTKSNNKGAMDNVWAIAAVAALGAMFLTIILCTTVLYCDWRKRKERRNRKRTVAGGRRGNPHDYANGNGSRGNHGKHSPRGGDSSHPNDGWNSSNGDEFNSLPSMDTEALRVVIPVPSGETDDQTPSPSTQGSDERDVPSHQNGVGKGTLRLSKSIRLSQKHKPSDDRARSRSTSVGRRGVSLPNLIKSKAANARLEETAGPAEQEDYVPEMAPSETYSVGEDTTVLFPAVHRMGGVGGSIGGGSAGGGSGILGRQSSKEADGNSYISDGEFDGYSVDAASTLEQSYGFDPSGGKGRGSGSANGSRGGGGNSLYSGDIPRDFDSVWDDESKITTSMDDDTFMNGMDRNRATAMQVNDETKKTYGDLSKNLSELVEHQFGDNKSTDSSSKNVNLYELDSGSESGSSNRGAFTLELLGHNKASMGKKSTDDEDSILGDMYSQDGSLGLADEFGSVAEGDKVPSSADSVDSTPSWAAPIQSALLRSSNASKAAAGATNPSGTSILRAPPSSTPLSPTVEYPSEDDSSSKQSRDRVKDKFVSSLSKNENDDRSSRSNGSNRSGKSNNSNRNSASFNDSNTSLSSSVGNENSRQPALGASRSEDYEIDDDPEEMIESINNMLSECRGILDRENSN